MAANPRLYSVGKLLDKGGFPWTILIWAAFTFVTYGLALMTLKPRLPVRTPTRGEARGKFMPVDTSFLKSPIVIIMARLLRAALGHPKY